MFFDLKISTTPHSSVEQLETRGKYGKSEWKRRNARAKPTHNPAARFVVPFSDVNNLSASFAQQLFSTLSLSLSRRMIRCGVGPDPTFVEWHAKDKCVSNAPRENERARQTTNNELFWWRSMRAVDRRCPSRMAGENFHREKWSILAAWAGDFTLRDDERCSFLLFSFSCWLGGMCELRK